MGKVGVKPGQQGTNMPDKNKTEITAWNKLQPNDLIRITETVFEEIQTEIKNREQLELLGHPEKGNPEAVAQHLEAQGEDSEEEEEEDADEDEDEEDNVNDDAYLAPSSAKKYRTPPMKMPRTRR